MSTILITGINGFLGSSLAKALKKKYNIIGFEYSIENLYRLKMENFKVYPVKNGIPEEVFKEQQIDIIIHAATLYGKNEDLGQIAHANLFLPFILLDTAIRNNCSLFINTDTVLDRYTNSYALTKYQFRDWCFMRKNEIKVTNMQLEHFYGPGASQNNFITAMINRLKHNEAIIDLTLGEQQRDFIYIDDVVSAYLKVMGNQEELKDDYTSFQVCSGELISIKKLMLTLKEITQSKSLLDFGSIPYRQNEMMKSDSDNSSLIKLGWSPKYSITMGINTTVNDLINSG